MNVQHRFKNPSTGAWSGWMPWTTHHNDDVDLPEAVAQILAYDSEIKRVAFKWITGSGQTWVYEFKAVEE